MAFVERLRGSISRRIKLSKLPRNRGFCPICESPVTFIKKSSWLRDDYVCNSCGSIPRNRALVNTLNIFYPQWKDLSVHESSPGGVLSEYFKRQIKDYSSSHYFEDVPRGEYKNGYRSEDLSALSFQPETYDLFITSDVFEHIMEPAKAFAEIARVLRPGGAHVFTMPWYPSLENSVQRAKVENNQLVHLETPVYHGNPINNEGSLVTYDWGRDFTQFIFDTSSMFTTTYLERNIRLGLDAEFLEVFISSKSFKK